MFYVKSILVTVFFALNMGSVFAAAIAGNDKLLQQNNDIICGEKSCDFLFKEMRKFAGNGSSEAQAVLSLLYADGIGTQVDNELSVKYIKRAANNGLAFAEFQLGMLLREGITTDKFGRDAEFWLSRAAKANYPPALAIMAKNPQSETDVNLQAYYTPTADESLEVIKVSPHQYSLTDIYDRLKNQGYNNGNQTGSRIKGQGCGNSASPCGVWDIHSPGGQIEWVLFTLKISR